MTTVFANKTGSAPQVFSSVSDAVCALQPREPVYCLYPELFARDVARFRDGFPGRVMYAVKANPEPLIVAAVSAAGITDFDAASIQEMQTVHAIDPAATCYFMAPVRLRGAAGTAYRDHGVRHFVIDHEDELTRVCDEVREPDIVVFVRMATSNPDATYNLSEKFGATPERTVALLREVDRRGLVPALAFNTGSLVRRPDAYVAALERCQSVLDEAGVTIRQLDVGGGFPSDYPDMKSEPLEAFFEAIDRTRQQLPLLQDVELLAEPGRALIAGGMSLLVQVLHRHDDRLYINDGVWGSLMEPVLSKGELRYPSRVYRGGERIDGETIAFDVFGPTCDSMDRLPAPLPLPAAIRSGDYIEFSTAGAYSLSNRTRFNGFYPDTFVTIDGDLPPTA